LIFGLLLRCYFKPQFQGKYLLNLGWKMVWGQSAQSGVDDLCKRLRENDPKLVSLILLRHRRCGAEEVSKLCDALMHSHTLKELSISAHSLDVASAQALAGMLAANNSISSISIGDSKFGCAGMVALAPGIAASTSLTSVDAELKGVGVEGAEALGRALSQSKSVTQLCLGNNPLGDEGVRALCNHPWPSLRTLDLSACGMGDAGLAALSTAPSAPTLTSLTCRGSSGACPDVPSQGTAGTSGTKSGAGGAGEGAQSVTQGKGAGAGEAGMQLSSSSVGAAASSQTAAAVGALMRACTSMQQLRLQHMGLGDAGAAAAANAIQQQGAGRCLTTLDLGHNGIGETGGLAIADAFTCTTCPLATLSLEGNPGINDAVTTLIAETTVRRCSTSGLQPLAHLDLSGTGAGVASIQSLSTVPHLRKLSLLGCKLGDEGAAALAESLKHASELQAPDSAAQGGFQDLQELVVSGCGFSREGVEVLMQALAAGKGVALTSVEMGGNPCCQADDFQRVVMGVVDLRPDLAIHWRAAATGSDGHGMQ